MDYGLAAHRLFEAAARGGLPADPGAYVLRLLREADLEEGLAGEVTAALDALTSSSLWQQLQESEAVYTEVPLARPARSGDRPGVLRGVIDLIYRTPEGWKIVDYKTDAVPSDDVARAVVDRYSRQVQAYADHWETVTGEPVTEKGIWLTAVGRFRSV